MLASGLGCPLNHGVCLVQKQQNPERPKRISPANSPGLVCISVRPEPGSTGWILTKEFLALPSSGSPAHLHRHSGFLLVPPQFSAFQFLYPGLSLCEHSPGQDSQPTDPKLMALLGSWIKCESLTVWPCLCLAQLHFLCLLARSYTRGSGPP